MNALEDSANTDRCTLYEESANFFKKRRTLYEDRIPVERWTSRTHETPRGLVRQSETKRKQALQTKLIAQNTQHKLGVAFSYLDLERNYYNVFCKQFDRNEYFSPFEFSSAEIYPRCERLFTRGFRFRFRSSLKKWPATRRASGP